MAHPIPQIWMHVALSRFHTIVIGVTAVVSLVATGFLSASAREFILDAVEIVTGAGAPPDTPDASTPPPPAPTHLASTVDVRSVSAEQHVTGDAPLAPDDATMTAAIAFVETALRDHIDDLQAGGPGRLAEVALPGLFEGADPIALMAATSDLATPEDPATDVALDLRVEHDGAPRFIRAVITSTRRSGVTMRTTFVFAVTDEGLRLTAFGATDPATESTS